MDAGYTLVVCEKPDAARRISEALSDGTATNSVVEGTTVFEFVRKGESYVVCSAQGHLYSVSDPCQERAVYPAFDLEWFPTDQVDDKRGGSAKRISAFKKLASGASKFVNACDLDVEGETIGHNLLKYACQGKEGVAFRARFSTLTKEELVKSFDGAAPLKNQGLARSGRARHLVDFVWGVNLSRLLSRSTSTVGSRFRTVTIGRVQGPTLDFLVQREKEIREFVPVPHWKVFGTFERDGMKLRASYSRAEVETKDEAQRIQDECLGKTGVVSKVERRTSQVGPPTPFDTGDLQKEAFRVFHLTPSRTLQAAERLYLGALISYPRTGSQALPASIGYAQIVRGLGRIPDYRTAAGELLGSELKPVQGHKTDPAHPAIHPTGEKPPRPLAGAEAQVFDLIVRRFLAAFGPSARRETVVVGISVGERVFRVEGGRTIYPGWAKYYGVYSSFRDSDVPPLSEGARLPLTDVTVEEKFDQKPARYNQGSLLQRMEEQRIGTKATRAEVISTLVTRGYVTGDSMEVTDLGLAVAETMSKYAPSIITTGLTREVEEKLQAVEAGSETATGLLRETVREIADRMVDLDERQEEVGAELGKAAAEVAAKSYVLGPCPVCRTGKLKLIVSRTTRKRFVGCSNYPSGCRASAPLPQRGKVKPTSKVCGTCSWPVVYVTGRRFPWRLCVNPNCPTKESRRT